MRDRAEILHARARLLCPRARRLSMLVLDSPRAPTSDADSASTARHLSSTTFVDARAAVWARSGRGPPAR
jgi:hypothetical protein